MASNQHVTYPNVERGHKYKMNNTEDGACLTGHDGRYRKVSCSYRWQAHKVSKESRESIYNIEPRRSKRYARGVTTSRYWTEKGDKFPQYYAFRIPFPKGKDWFLDGPERPIVRRGRKPIPPKKNFTKDTWPYWHNAHHLIPKATFNAVVNASDYAAQIRRALLKAKYNINHKINMVILPQDREVGRLLKLPRHLVLKEPGRTPQVADHLQYEDLIIGELQGIIDRYARIFDEAKGKDHKVPKPSLDRKKLERLSRRCYRTILEFGKMSPGLPLDDIEGFS